MLPKDSPDIKCNIADADCLLVNPFVFNVDAKFIDAAPKLRYIGVLSTGYGAVDSDYASGKGITVCNIPGYATESVAELAFAVILEYMRDIEYSKRMARESNFSDTPRVPVSELKGKKFGIIGLGQIGQRVAELALAFGANVLYWSRNRNKEFETKGIKYQDIETLLSKCDFVSLHLSFNKETELFLNETRIVKIKPGALLLNLAPNELIDYNALEKRLAKGDIVYIMDHADELTPEHAKRLSQYKNCIMYPPIGYTTKEATKAKQEIFIGNISGFLKGKIENKVN